MSRGIRLFPHFLCLSHLARLETPALLGSHLGSRFEPEATEADVRVEWSRQRARSARVTEASKHPLYPHPPSPVNVMLPDSPFEESFDEQILFEEDRRGGPEKCNFMYLYLNRIS